MMDTIAAVAIDESNKYCKKIGKVFTKSFGNKKRAKVVTTGTPMMNMLRSVNGM